MEDNNDTLACLYPFAFQFFIIVFIANVLFPISLLSVYDRHVAVIFYIKVEAKRNKGSRVFSSLKTYFLKLLNK